MTATKTTSINERYLSHHPTSVATTGALVATPSAPSPCRDQRAQCRNGAAGPSSTGFWNTTVTEVNPALGAQSELLNSDPYDKGYLMKIQVSDPSSAAALLTSSQYAEISS